MESFEKLLFTMEVGQEVIWKVQTVDHDLKEESRPGTAWSITKVPNGWIFKTNSAIPVFVPLTTYSNPNI